MAVDIGPKIGIQGEAEYRKQLNNIITQTKTLHAEVKAMESAWGKDTSAKQKAAQQSKLLNTAITTQKQKLSELQKGLDESAKKYGENDTRTLKWKQAVANATTELNKLEAQLRKVPNSLQLMGKSMQEVGTKIQTVGKGMSSVGSTLTKSVTVPLTAMAAAAVKTTASFDTSMSKVGAVSGATGEDFEALRAKAREMGATTKFSATEAADAMTYMAMAGWKTDQMLTGVEGIMNLAAASGEDLATTSDIVTDALTAFGQSAGESGRLADIMAAASSNANTNVAMMGETFKYAAPVAGALGFTMEDTSVAIGLMANAGIKGSQAGTALRKGMTNLVKPTKAMSAAMEKYGIEVTNTDGSMKSMREIMGTLRKNLGSLTEAEKASAVATIFGQQAMSGWLAVVNSSDADFENLTRAIDNSSGVAKNMAETMQDNLAGQLTILKSQLQELGISFGDILVPKIRLAVEWVQRQVDKFNAMDDATKEQIVKYGLLAAAIGPVLTVTGKLVSATGSLVSAAGSIVSGIGGMVAKHTANAAAATADATATTAATTATKAFNTTLTASPIGAIALAITGAVAAILALKKGYDNIKKSAKAANEEMYSSIDAVNETSQEMEDATTAIKKGFQDSAKAITEVEASAKSATSIAGKIEELTKKQSLNREEQTRLKALVGEMNSIYPQMALAIDETGQSLNMSTEEIKSFIQSSYDMAKAAAYADAVKASLEAMAEAELAVAKAEIEAESLQKQLTSAEQEREAQIEATKTAMEGYDDVMRELTAAGSELSGGTTVQTVAMREAEKALEDNKTKQEETTTALEEARSEYELNQAALEQLCEELGISVEELTGTGDAAGEMGDALSAASDDAAGAAETMEDAVDSALQEMQDAYMKTAESASNSIMNQKGLFQELEAQESTSIEAMRKGLESHIEAYQNWNENAKTLMSSSRYQTDENFRAMVNSVVSAGQDMAPELQAITDAFESGDAELEGLVSDYGTMSRLSDEVGHATAQAEIAMQYGLEGLEQVMTASEDGIAGAADGVVDAAAGAFDKKTLSKAARLEARDTINTLSKNLNSNAPAKALAKTIDKGAKENTAKAVGVGKGVGTGYAKGSEQSVPILKTALGKVGTAFKAMTANVKGMATGANAAGKDVTTATGKGADAGTTSSITPAMNRAKTVVDTGITGIKAKGPQANAAGATIATSTGTGISTNATKVKTAMDTVRTNVNSGISAISGLKGKAKSAGEGVSGAAATGLNSNADKASTYGSTMGSKFVSGVSSHKKGASSAGSTLASNAATGTGGYSGTASTNGSTLGSKFASGVSSKNGAASTAGSTLASKAAAGTGTGSGTAKTWGEHLGQNFADGVLSKVQAVAQAAAAVAAAAAKPLKHSTPTIGPLKDDDIWGLHMGENFVMGMDKSIPLIKAAAMEMARAAVIDVATPLADAGVTSGSYAAAENTLTGEAIYEAMAAAFNEMSFSIGEREFGRVLREYGAIA